MKIQWTIFSGIRPKVDDRLLPDGNAQVADNVNTERGGVRPMEGTLDVMPLTKTGVKTIYRFGLATDSATQYWFHWATDVDVVKGPINNDTAERTYWTGDGAPKYTTAALGTTGTDLPSASRPLGVPAPTASPTLAASGAFEAGASNETRVYVYTFVTDMGEESAPSEPGTVTIKVGQGVTLSDLQTAASNGAVLTNKRIYRAQRGLYLFVAEIAATATTFADTVASDRLGEVCPSLNWDPPSASMTALTAGPNGMMAAIDGYTVRLCEPFRPHAWPMDYAQTSQFPCVGVGQFGQSFVVLTTGNPFILTGSNPGSMSMEPAKFYQPCLSKRSIVSAGGSVIWASPDGLVSLGADGENNLTETLFTPEQWRALRPETMIGKWHEGWYVGAHDPGTGAAGFMFRPRTQEWIPLPTVAATAMYRDTVSDALYMAIGDHIHKFRAGADMPFRWKSREVLTPLTDFAAARVTGAYPLTFKLYRDGALKMTKTVGDDEPFKLPSGLGRMWEVEVSGSNELLGVALATSEVVL